MGKKHYELVSNTNDIKLNVQEFMRILSDERNAPVINRFTMFTYWYFFPDLRIFVPNKFLGYKNSAHEIYQPSPGSGMDGGSARKALEHYFDKILDEKRFNILRSDLIKFSENYGGIKEKVFILEPKKQYLNEFSKILPHNRNKDQIYNDPQEMKSPISQLLSEKIDSRSESLDGPVHKRIVMQEQDSKGLIKREDSGTKPTKAILIEKDSHEKPYEITQRVRKLILSINEIHEFNNKKPVFVLSSLFKLWEDIEKQCGSKSEYKDFVEAIYKVIRETTRYKNPKYRNSNDQYYISTYPTNFTKNDPEMINFIRIVNVLRHYYVHDEIGQTADVYEELLGNRSGPQTTEDFQNLQVEVLKRFEKAMKKLFSIVSGE